MRFDLPSRKLLSLAYNILGSYQDAKDVVQDVLLERLSRQDLLVENETAYLVRSVINRAITRKNKQKKIVTGYPGPWLPEPVVTEGADYDIEQTEILSYSLMVLLEKLDARARAVFILREAFEYDHAEIASVLQITPENSRAILSRAKKQLGREPALRPSSAPSGYLDRYLQIIRNGDMEKLEALLHEDIVSTSDGGGKAVAAMHPVVGRAAVILFLSGVFRKFYSLASLRTGQINHQPAIFYVEENRIVTCQILQFEGGRLERVYFIRNPDKLTTLNQLLIEDACSSPLP